MTGLETIKSLEAAPFWAPSANQARTARIAGGLVACKTDD